MSSEAEKKAEFDKIDTDGDGVISAEELKTHLQGGNSKVSDANAASLFKWADDNSDGEISFKEYAEFVR
ncbi:EF-hand domain-containing protein [Kitasatospora brasiliensis]|uniref:EF-hand domain-containing protein n=1 Tax=Kitasatospora brasiliensis TaxID=3058040 RepID=UPI00292F5956|nr:EF-hand domain-containing protein [Kitasatospora sp. K002]